MDEDAPPPPPPPPLHSRSTPNLLRADSMFVGDKKRRTIEEKKEALNFVFGFVPWKGHISKRPLSERSEAVKSLYEPVNKVDVKKVKTTLMISFGNVLYLLLFGWWMFLVYFLFSLLCFISIICIPHGKLLFQLSFFYLWPFGKYVERMTESHVEMYANTSKEVGQNNPSQRNNVGENIEENLNQEQFSETTRLLSSASDSNLKKDLPRIEKTEGDAEEVKEPNDPSTCINVSGGSSYYSSTKWKGRTVFEILELLVFCVLISPMLLLAHGFVIITSWYTIFMIPTCKIHRQGAKILFKFPRSVRVSNQFPPAPGSDIYLCSYQAFNIFYYKYSVFGMNVILFNLFPIVFVSLILGYALPHHIKEMLSIPTFICCLFSTMPLAYYIGKAVSSISAQTSFTVGAFLNASFGSIIELILYFLTLSKGMGVVVRQAVTGSLIGNMLLMPGLAMIFGGIKHKEQRFNKNAAGVSSVLLFISLVGAFTPTIFYQIHGQYDLDCSNCATVGDRLDCTGCSYKEKRVHEDPVFLYKARYLSYACAVILPVAYLVGLIFSLKTHSYLYEKANDGHDHDEEEQGHKAAGHGSAEWGTLKSLLILIGATILFALVAEAMTDAMSPALKAIQMNEEFAGLTLLAVIPNVAEYSNAIQFSLLDNITLSLEIANVGAIQIALIQIPILVLASNLLFMGNMDKIFTLIFPQFDLFAIFFAIIILNYISIDGRCNYFEGTSLVIVYLLIIASFFFSYQI